VWVDEQNLKPSEDEQYICMLCAFMFTMLVSMAITEAESELLFKLLKELRDAKLVVGVKSAKGDAISGEPGTRLHV
jgi:hypothetical protein